MATLPSTPDEVINLVVTKLKTAVKDLNNRDKVKVEEEEPVSVDLYTLAHPRGALLVIDGGDKFTDKEHDRSVVVQNRNSLIAVLCIIRATEKGMKPREYKELCIDTLSGIEVSNHRPDRKIKCDNTELIKEVEGVWWYSATFIAPLDFYDPTV